MNKMKERIASVSLNKYGVLHKSKRSLAMDRK